MCIRDSLVAGSVNTLIGLGAGGLPGTGPALAALAVGAVGYGFSITLWVAGARDLGAGHPQGDREAVADGPDGQSGQGRAGAGQATRAEADQRVHGPGDEAVSYTHLTLPTILRV